MESCRGGRPLAGPRLRPVALTPLPQISFLSLREEQARESELFCQVNTLQKQANEQQTLILDLQRRLLEAGLDAQRCETQSFP